MPRPALVRDFRDRARERRVLDERLHIHVLARLHVRADADRELRVSPQPIVRHCHERWDGAGYPDALVGEAIPLESRIIFVCDAFHAMTTERPYRKRLSTAEAVRRLRDAAGAQFDPRVVEACLGVLREDSVA